MHRLVKYLSSSTISAIILWGIAPYCSADSLIVNRPLPTANLNGLNDSSFVAGCTPNSPPNDCSVNANRSNNNWFVVATDPTATDFMGDNFQTTLGGINGGSGAGWNLKTITLWMVDFQGDNLGDDFDKIYLYAGAGALNSSNNALHLLVSADFVAGTSGVTNISNSNASVDSHATQVIFTQETYTGPTGYFGDQSGDPFTLWRIDFNNLFQFVPSSSDIEFGIYAPSSNGSQFDLHATNFANSGLTGSLGDSNGWDNFIMICNQQNLAGGCNFGDTNSIANGGNGFWNKSSDFNVQVTADAIPEPTDAALVGTGLMLLGLVIRSRRKK